MVLASFILSIVGVIVSVLSIGFFWHDKYKNNIATKVYAHYKLLFDDEAYPHHLLLVWSIRQLKKELIKISIINKFINEFDKKITYNNIDFFPIANKRIRNKNGDYRFSSTRNLLSQQPSDQTISMKLVMKSSINEKCQLDISKPFNGIIVTWNLTKNTIHYRPITEYINAENEYFIFDKWTINTTYGQDCSKISKIWLSPKEKRYIRKVAKNNTAHKDPKLNVMLSTSPSMLIKPYFFMKISKSKMNVIFVKFSMKKIVNNIRNNPSKFTYYIDKSLISKKWKFIKKIQVGLIFKSAKKYNLELKYWETIQNIDNN